MNEAAFEEYMRISTELHASSVGFLSSMTEEEFLDHLLWIANGDGRSSMIVAAIRESICDRTEGMLN